ncbi:MAG: OmpH family outer membrane protein [Pseudomonadota bacterium]
MMDLKKTAYGLFLGVSAMVVTVLTAHATDGLKIGTVDMERVFRSSTAVKATAEKLQRIDAESKAAIGTLTQEQAQLEGKLKQEGPSMGDQERKDLNDKLLAKREQLNQERDVARVKVSFARKSEQNRFRSEFKRAVTTVAAQEGLELVLVDESVLYSKATVDLTEKLVKIIDAALSENTGKKEEGADKKPTPESKPAAPAAR